MPKLVPQDDPAHAMPTDLETRALAAVLGTRKLDDLFMCALRKANQLFGAALMLQLSELRASPDPIKSTFAQKKELELQLAFAFQTIDVLLERLGKIPPQNRPRYTKPNRGRILHHKDALHLSCREVARLYALTRSTVHRWVVDSIVPKRAESPLVAPSPPDRSYSELVKQQVRNLVAAGLGGPLRVAQTLALEGIRVSKSSVFRWTKSAPARSPFSPESSIEGQKSREKGSAENALDDSGKALRAERPNHVLMTDVTAVKSLTGSLWFHLAVVIDVFSRFPLAFRLFRKQPSAQEMADLLDTAVARAKRFHPELSLDHFVCDEGPFFTARPFQERLVHHGMKVRFGAVGRHGSIAIIERFWKGLKDLLNLRFDRRLALEDVESRIGLGLFYSAVLKPHQALRGATPAEVYFEKEPAYLSAVPPPRRGEDEASVPRLEVKYLDAAQRLPFLLKKAA